MARILPNDPCPCGSGFKFKKCCGPYLKGDPVETAERLLRTRYAAHANHDVKFIWDTAHPMSPRKLNDTWAKFEREYELLRSLDYRGLTILDEKSPNKNRTVIVYWVKVFEGEQDLSFLEEATFELFEGRWLYFDGLRRSANRLGCLPESVRIGDLATLFPHDSELH